MATKRLLPLTLRLPKPSSLISRNYHTPSQPTPSPFPALETAILTSSLPHIPEHGFTPTTLRLGAHAQGYIPASQNLFPQGAFALVHFHLWRQREALKDCAVVKDAGKGVGVGRTVKELTWERLLGNREVIHRWQEALALTPLPSNLPTALRELHALSDEIWYLAGDTSVDTSWYTKRATLSTIYAATELFMTTDKSPNFKDTREFLDRRFEDSRVLGEMVGSVGEWVGFNARAGLNVLRSRGVRI
ncbi:hypothetical protein HYFRA_00009610 [Hymenoscyphus fraxineus]|uniref:Ubiquinone biosynthesis protein n=1 Tax=Hymenoscyphus fraxineus TaxID=746836 RepID=A0A9N9PSG8_9HELO|nr:hypothetical protein HYFRA_00009610 [Hymenoscyphus fraxineus]